MDFAIIAAGDGARLAEEGSKVPKPLVTLNGTPLIDRLIDVFISNGAEEVHIIINESSAMLETHVQELSNKVPIRLIVKSTPDSLHSFGALIPGIGSKDICLTTVDTVFDEAEFAAYIQAFIQQKELDALAAVTTFVDDEKPLYVATDDTMNIVAFKDNNDDEDCKYISGGIYCLRARAYQSALNTLADGKSRMRDFQRRMVSDGLKIVAHNFSKIIDVDHVRDIQTAEEMLQLH